MAGTESLHRHIAVSLEGILVAHHELPLQLIASLSVDGRGERELGALLILDERLRRHLEMVVNPGILNRLHQAGERLLNELKTQPASIVGGLTRQDLLLEILHQVADIGDQQCRPGLRELDQRRLMTRRMARRRQDRDSIVEHVIAALVHGSSDSA